MHLVVGIRSWASLGMGDGALTMPSPSLLVFTLMIAMAVVLRVR